MGKAQLESLDLDELKKLAMTKGLPIGKKDMIVESLIAHDTRMQDAAQMHEIKVQEVLAQKKDELEEKTNNELKYLCISKGLPQGVTRDSRIQRLLEDIRSNGEVDKVIMVLNRDARAAELHAMDM